MALLERREQLPVAAVILAAGTSARMGRTKQLLPYDGAPLLQASIDAAAASDLMEIIVVLGHQAEEIRSAVMMPVNKPLRFVVCEDYASGQSASLACGLGASADNVDAVAVLLGDQPDIDAVAINRVVAAWRDAFEPVVRPVFVSEKGRRLPGHPVVLARAVWSALAVQVGDFGARSWLRAHPEYVREVEIAATAPRDVDTWEDYLRIANRQERGR
jgi:molybdenum cofactor cytidylyltransferase